jgi:LacI family transcriptional regulator
MDRRITGPGLSDVLINNTSGMDQAIKHLKDLGHKEIGFIGGTIGPTISDRRAQAFIKAMKRHGLKPNPEFMRVGNYRAGGSERTPEHHWTSIFDQNKLDCAGVYRACKNVTQTARSKRPPSAR